MSKLIRRAQALVVVAVMAAGALIYRVRAICSSLQHDSKARGVLERNGGVNSYTQWFTRTGFYYVGSWGNCMAGCTAKVEIRGV